MTAQAHRISRRKPSLIDANSQLPSNLVPLLKGALSSVSHSLEYDWGILPGTPVQDAPNAFVAQRLHLLDSVFSKYVDESTLPAEERRDAAISKWLTQERKNEITNERLVNLCDGFRILPHTNWSTFRDFVCASLVEMLGETIPVEALLGSFSGGASTSRPRTKSLPAQKFIGKADITSAAIPWFDIALTEMPGWSRNVPDYELNIVEGNVIFTVPKSTTIDRCAAKEPDLNMFLQKGVGDYIRQRLRKFGINLNDQSRNRYLARKGSVTGTLATIDLSSASDSICTELVRQFIPTLWFSLMESLRSPVTMIGDEKHVNEMFSSMGNGFTFELESLLFYVITRAVAYFEGVPGVISVYGDDIICPSYIVPQLEFVFSTLGFTINRSKSFSEGPFRESCGGHYFLGRDITPFYVKEPITSLVDSIRVCNQIRTWSAWGDDGDFVYDPQGSTAKYYLDDDLLELWKLLASFVPKQFWGGRDLASTTRLVSKDAPMCVLVPITRDEDMGLGGFVHWLCSTTGRSLVAEGVETSTVTRVMHLHRSRRVLKRHGVDALRILWENDP